MKNKHLGGCNDGRICLWTLEMMSQPQHIFDLHSSSLQVNTTCLTLREGETDGFLIGTENGMVHQLNLHSK